MRPSIWTPANLLSLSRIAAAPAVAGLIFTADSLVHTAGMAAAAGWLGAAAAVFALAAATDAADGWLARRSGGVSPFGAALDHAADKTLVAAALIALSITFSPADLVIAALIIVLRDLCVAGLREGLALSGAALPVSKSGKLKTFAEMLGVVAAITGHALALLGASGAGLAAVELAARGLLYLAAVLALVTLFVYFSSIVRLVRST